MWKYYTKEHHKDFVLSLGLIDGNLSDAEKLNILYSIANNPKKYYTKKYILKKDGTKRELLVPNVYLKNIQKRILHNVLDGLKPSEYVQSYMKNKSLIYNAKPHEKAKVILKLDIKDFFPSINFEMLYNVLPSEIFPKEMKVLLLNLCLYDNYLPQGAPTSPMLSNLALKSFDNYIGEYVRDQNINYTRYADDLTFSGDFNPYKLKNKVEAFLNVMGFNLNHGKTKIITQAKRQVVTGLVVNEKVSIPKIYRQEIRKDIYYIKKYGIWNHLEYIKYNGDKIKYLESLKGKINYVLNVMRHNKEFLEYLTLVNNYLNDIKV